MDAGVVQAIKDLANMISYKEGIVKFIVNTDSRYLYGEQDFNLLYPGFDVTLRIEDRDFTKFSEKPLISDKVKSIQVYNSNNKSPINLVPFWNLQYLALLSNFNSVQLYPGLELESCWVMDFDKHIKFDS